MLVGNQEQQQKKLPKCYTVVEIVVGITLTMVRL